MSAAVNAGCSTVGDFAGNGDERDGRDGRDGIVIDWDFLLTK